MQGSAPGRKAGTEAGRAQESAPNGGSPQLRRVPQGEPRAAAILAPATFMWLVAGLAQLFRIPFDAALVGQAFPPPYDRLNLQARAPRVLGFGYGRGRVPGPVVSIPDEPAMATRAPSIMTEVYFGL